VAAACTQATPCDGPADCDDRDANTTDTCNADGACEYAPICSGADCTKNPCSPSFVAEGGLKIAVLDVGQGDAIAVVAPSGCAALVDGGPTFSGSIIRGYLRTQGVTKVDFAVASHYHADHLGGLDEVEQGSDPMPVMRTYDRGRSQAPTDSSSYDQYASNYGDRRQQVAVGDSFALCEEVCFQVVAVNANGVSTEDENARSVVLRLRYGAFTMLLGGDLTGGVESDISSRVGEVDVYKVHHHGSASSSTSGFLSKLRPTASVVSVGWDNSFGHPSAAALDRLDSVESSVWKTESYTRPLGNVEISVDSATGYTVSQGTARAEFTIKPGK
jgi:beta-lactamase superfamily II metal-dependent hydrolase